MGTAESVDERARAGPRSAARLDDEQHALRRLARLAIRKAVYRRVKLTVWGAPAKRHPHLAAPPGLRIVILEPENFDSVATTSPYLTADDIAEFRRQHSRCIVVFEGERVVASSWMTCGDVYVHELHRHITVASDEHFSCRSYVDPAYRGRALLSCMITAYARELPGDDFVWGLVYDWNAASVRSLERIGWQRRGEMWTRFALGRTFPGERRLAQPLRPEGNPPCVLIAAEAWGGPLHAMRSLGRRGVDVYVATLGRGADVYGRSRWCVGARDLQNVQDGDLAMSLREWLDGLPGRRPFIVIPFSDRIVEELDRSREVFGDGYALAIPDADVVETLIDKRTSLAAAERAGLAVPPWVAVTDSNDLSAVDALTLPIVVRPARWSSAGSRPFKVEVFAERETLRRELQRLVSDGAAVIVQNYVLAPDQAVEFGILWRSRSATVTVVCTGRKLRQSSARGGVMAWGEAADLSDVRVAAERFLESTSFTGLGGIELIRSDEVQWFIEFNPRIEATHFLAMRAGVDTVQLAYDELAFGEQPAHPPVQGPATAWVGSAWLQRIQHSHLDVGLALHDRLAFAFAPARVRAVWSWRDPLPALAVAGRLVRRAATALRSQRSPRPAPFRGRARLR